MSDNERLDILEEKLAELLRKQDIVDEHMKTLVARLANMEAQFAEVHARQERWLTLLGFVSTEQADQHTNLWQYPAVLRQSADSRQN